MITSVIIVFLFLNEFIAFLFASERLKMYNTISGKDKENLSSKEKRVLINVIFRFFLEMIYFDFIIYGLFTVLWLYCLLTLLVGITSFTITYHLSKCRNSLTNRIWVARFDAIITMLIWLGPLLEIVRTVI